MFAGYVNARLRSLEFCDFAVKNLRQFIFHARGAY